MIPRSAAQDLLDLSIRFLPRLWREAMAAIRMPHGQPLGHAIEIIDLSGCRRDCVHTLPFEVRVAEWRADETCPWCESPDHLMEVERDFLQGIIEQLRHVARAGATFDISIHVIVI